MTPARQYLRSLRGPVMLTALDSLLVADHFGPQPIFRTWPVLLVVLGVMILLEHLVKKPEGGPQT